MADRPPRRVRFGSFELDVERLVLWRDGEVVPLQKLPARVLARLVTAGGEVVTRRELLEEFWGGRRIGFDDRLNTCVMEIRRALGDSAGAPAFVETVRGRGYRFRGVVRDASEGDRTPVEPGVRPRRSASGRRLRRVIAAGVVGSGLVLAPVIPVVLRDGGPAATATPAGADGRALGGYLRAWGLIRTGRVSDLRAASAALDEAIATDPAFAAAHSARAVTGALLALDASEPDALVGARSHLARAEALSPGAPHVRDARRVLEIASGPATGRSATGWRGGREADPIVRSLDADARGDVEVAVRALKRTLTVRPNDARSWAELAEDAAWMGRLDEAARLYETAAAQEPGRPELHIARARVALARGSGADAALAILREAARRTGISPEYLAPMDPRLAVPLANALRWRDAEGDRFERAYDRGVFHLSVGLMSESVSDSVAAREAFTRALTELVPLTMADESWAGTPDYHAFVGLARSGLGDAEGARVAAEEIRRRFSVAPAGPRSDYMLSLAAWVARRADLVSAGRSASDAAPAGPVTRRADGS